MKRDIVTDVGIGVVGIAAAILTFTTLRDLAVACGITGELWKLKLAYLVPITVDAAGIVATRVWLRGTDRPEAVRFARGLAWSCIVASVVGNAGQHGMAAYRLVVPWWVVVLVSAVPPAMLGAVVHLGHLRTAGPDRQTADRTGPDREETGTPVPNVETGLAVPNVETGPDWTDPWDRWAGPAVHERTAVERTAVLEPGPAADQGRTGRSGQTDDEILAALAGRTGITRNAIMREFSVGTSRADRLRTAAIAQEES